LRDLHRGRYFIRRIGIGHGLDHDRRASADPNGPNHYTDALTPRDGRGFGCHRLFMSIDVKLIRRLAIIAYFGVGGT
jgi:hypothetical protein